MRMARGVAAVAVAGALVAGTATAAAAGEPRPAASPAPPPGAVRWSPPLEGEAAGVDVEGGTVRVTGASEPSAAGVPAGSAVPRPGLLTLPARRTEVRVDRVDAAVETDAPQGVTVDVRGRRADGGWTEWVPAEGADAAGRTTAVLPAAATEVQARLVLDPQARPAVRRLTLTARPAPGGVGARDDEPPAPPRSHRVFATREGLVGGTTANGHVITERDLFVALPSRRALSPRDTSDYSVKVCAPGGRCAFAPVWDVGPWNTRDDYWSPSPEREDWRDLPQGLPQSQAAKENGHNGGKDQFGRTVVNPAGIDLADGLFHDALGLTDNEWVTVDYLWTGHSPLATVRVDGRVDLRAAPDAAAGVVGLVADRAAVPVQCAVSGGRWLQVGVGQFLPRSAVPRPGDLTTCPAAGR